MPAAIVTLLTDFGDADGFVGILKGVILAHAGDARIVDLSHHVPPQNVLAAALVLRSAVPYFPAGTLHLVVVDPGVGSARRALAVRSRGALFVAPDNGVLAPTLAEREAIEARVIANPDWIAAQISQTFHGRDVFAPVAGRLAAGADFAAVGPPVDGWQPLPVPAPCVTAEGIDGEVLYVDRFGNLITNIDEAALASFRHRPLSVTIAGRNAIGPLPAYAAAAEGELLAIVDSWRLLEIAVRNGSAEAQLSARPGTPVAVRARTAR